MVAVPADTPVTVNVALVPPPATGTVAGTVATAVLLLVSATDPPLAPIAEVRFTVPCDVAPATMLAGFSDTLATVGLDGSGLDEHCMNVSAEAMLTATIASIRGDRAVFIANSVSCSRQGQQS